MNYKPGLHILVEFNSPNGLLLESSGQSRIFFDDIIDKYNLQKVGEVYHDFPGGGFTAVVCLTESHLSIHTWPEFGLATFDIFLSNYRNDNTQKVRDIFTDVATFYNATVINRQEVVR